MFVLISLYVSLSLYSYIYIEECGSELTRTGAEHRGVKRSAAAAAFRRRWPFVCEMYPYSITFSTRPRCTDIPREARQDESPRYPGTNAKADCLS